MRVEFAIFRSSSAVEQLTVNQLVAGSNPASGAIRLIPSLMAMAISFLGTSWMFWAEQSVVEGLTMKFTVYILRNSANRLYIGYTKDLSQRLKDHDSSCHGAKFVKDYSSFHLVYTETYGTQLEAMRREKQLKGWTRAKKAALISADLVLLKKL